MQAWIAARFRKARVEAGLSQAQLAGELGVTQTAISYWESGKRVPNLDDLLDVAQALGRDVSFFLPQAQAREPATAILRAESARLADSELHEAIAGLLDRADQTELPSRELIVRAQQPTHAANELIDVGGVLEPPVDVEQLARRCGVMVWTLDFPDALSGLVVELLDGAIVGVNRRHPQVRRRFSLAHELGHHLLRHAERFHIDISDGMAADHDYASERAANEFAAELLMPRKFMTRAFDQDQNPEALADLFGVSQLAMGYRLINLGLR